MSEELWQFDQNLFDSLPVGLLTLDADAKIRNINQFARNLLSLGLDCSLNEVIHSDSLPALLELTAADVGACCELQTYRAESSIHTRWTVIERTEQGTVLVCEDISEKVALAAQLKSGKRPERKFVHEISNALTTTIGYTELINMMLEEHDEFSGERLAAIRRYEAEVFSGLRRADALIKDRRQGAAQQFSPAIPLNRKHVVVVDDEPQITDFLTELLRAKQYKVTAFTDGISALNYYRENGDDIDLIIMDQVMPEMSGISLATELLALDLNQPIVLCTGDQVMIDEQQAGNLNIKHFLSKPIDINELTDMVSHIIDQK